MYLPKPVAIDFTYVTPAEVPGAAATAAAKAKKTQHKTAVNNAGHDFAAFAGEDGGHHDNECVDIVKHISTELPEWQRKDFVQEMWHAVSTAYQRELAETFRAAMGLSRSRRHLCRW